MHRPSMRTGRGRGCWASPAGPMDAGGLDGSAGDRPAPRARSGARRKCFNRLLDPRDLRLADRVGPCAPGGAAGRSRCSPPGRRGRGPRRPARPRSAPRRAQPRRADPGHRHEQRERRDPRGLVALEQPRPRAEAEQGREHDDVEQREHAADVERRRTRRRSRPAPRRPATAAPAGSAARAPTTRAAPSASGACARRVRRSRCPTRPRRAMHSASATSGTPPARPAAITPIPASATAAPASWPRAGPLAEQQPTARRDREQRLQLERRATRARPAGPGPSPTNSSPNWPALRNAPTSTTQRQATRGRPTKNTAGKRDEARTAARRTAAAGRIEPDVDDDEVDAPDDGDGDGEEDVAGGHGARSSRAPTGRASGLSCGYP